MLFSTCYRAYPPYFAGSCDYWPTSDYCDDYTGSKWFASDVQLWCTGTYSTGYCTSAGKVGTCVTGYGTSSEIERVLYSPTYDWTTGGNYCNLTLGGYWF